MVISSSLLALMPSLLDICISISSPHLPSELQPYACGCLFHIPPHYFDAKYPCVNLNCDLHSPQTLPMLPLPPLHVTSLSLSMESLLGLHATLRTVSHHLQRDMLVQAPGEPLYSFLCSHPCSSYCPPTWGFSGPTVFLLNCKTVIPRQYRLEPAYLGGKAAPPLSSCVTSSKLLHFSILNFFSQCCVRAGE